MLNVSEHFTLDNAVILEECITIPASPQPVLPTSNRSLHTWVLLIFCILEITHYWMVLMPLASRTYWGPATGQAR